MSGREIKLVAADIDGTILPYGAEEVEDGLAETIAALQEKGIRFILASGRRYTSMRSLFPTIGDSLSYLCGNGSSYLEKGKIVFAHEIGLDYVKEMLEIFSEVPGLLPVLSGIYHYYAVVGPEGDNRQRLIQRYNGLMGDDYVAVSAAEDIEEPVCKLAIYVKPVTDKEALETAKGRLKGVTIVSGGQEWMDITRQGINKGRSLEQILLESQIDANHCMTFGDSENDVEMLRLTKHSYAMCRAEEKAKAAGNFQCSSVLETLRELL